MQKHTPGCFPVIAATMDAIERFQWDVGKPELIVMGLIKFKQYEDEVATHPEANSNHKWAICRNRIAGVLVICEVTGVGIVVM